MRRPTALLVLLAGTLAISSAAAQKSGFEFRGLSLGMDQNAFVSVVAKNSWAIPSYTRADGHGYFRSIEYMGMPELDSLVDEVLIESEGLMLACPEAGAATCVPVQSMKAVFRFGRLHALEISSINGQEKVFRPYALAALAELNERLGAGDKNADDIMTFFKSYNIDKAKTFAEVPIATWSGSAIASNGEPMPIEARVLAIRLTEKYDMAREEKGVFTPWGVCRIAVGFATPDVEARWAAVKAELKKQAVR